MKGLKRPSREIRTAVARSGLWVFCPIDYHLATPGVAAAAKREHIDLERRFSDHAPLTIDYDFKI